jgi:hypothetical protein
VSIQLDHVLALDRLEDFQLSIFELFVLQHVLHREDGASLHIFNLSRYREYFVDYSECSRTQRIEYLVVLADLTLHSIFSFFLVRLHA